MSPWWLLLIFPGGVLFGMFIQGLLFMGKDDYFE